MKTITFTKGEVTALLHRLEQWDCIEEVFADTEHLKHLATPSIGRSCDMVDELRKSHAIVVDELSELDREIMVEAIEGNTWIAIHHPDNDGGSKSKQRAAYRTLCGIADKVSYAFDTLVSDIDIPNY